jgi:hypothetical protein
MGDPRLNQAMAIAMALLLLSLSLLMSPLRLWAQSGVSRRLA